MWALLMLVQTATGSPAPPSPPRAAEEPSAEAQALLPAIVTRETDAMVAEHPEWTEDERDRFRALALGVAAAAGQRLATAMGDSYARRLSLKDLEVLVAFVEGEAAERWRAVEPLVVTDAIRALGAIDFRGAVMKAWCAQGGRGCG